MAGSDVLTRGQLTGGPIAPSGGRLPPLEIIIADARVYVSSVQGGEEYDIVYLDAFNSFSVPSHLN